MQGPRRPAAHRSGRRRPARSRWPGGSPGTSPGTEVSASRLRLQPARLDDYEVPIDPLRAGVDDQLLDHHLDHRVLALAEVVVADPPIDFGNVDRRPEMVGEGPPDTVVAVDRNRVFTSKFRVSRMMCCRHCARSRTRVDRAETGEIGTAYRIPCEPSHASQPRSPSNSRRHMRRMRQDP